MKEETGEGAYAWYQWEGEELGEDLVESGEAGLLRKVSVVRMGADNPYHCLVECGDIADGGGGGQENGEGGAGPFHTISRQKNGWGPLYPRSGNGACGGLCRERRRVFFTGIRRQKTGETGSTRKRRLKSRLVWVRESTFPGLQQRDDGCRR